MTYPSLSPTPYTQEQVRWALAVRWWIPRDEPLHLALPPPLQHYPLDTLAIDVGVPPEAVPHNLGPLIFARMTEEERVTFVLASGYAFRRSDTDLNTVYFRE